MSAILHVNTCTAACPDQAAEAVRRLRHAAADCKDGDQILLLCCLHDAPGKHMPQDDAIIRTLQSGVMSINARSSARFDLIIPCRTWNVAQRVYAGDPGPDAQFSIVRDLLVIGRTKAAFAAATITTSALQERFCSCCAVLFSSLSLISAPDTPRRMLAALQKTSGGCVCASVLEPREYPQSILSRLLAAGFSLWPPLPVFTREHRQDWPYMVSTGALRTMSVPGTAPSAPGCAFVRRESRTLSALLLSLRRDCLRRGSLYSLMPAVQLAVVLLSAALGFPVLLAAAFLPELPALKHPSRYPCILVRAALLPASALASLDAQLMRITAQTRYLRLRMPPAALRKEGSLAAGALLLAAAFLGVHALPAALPLALLWLSAPLFHTALDQAAIARIPPDSAQLSLLRSEAESLCLAVCGRETALQDVPLQMLCQAAGCMLHLLEPDEAARRAEMLLKQYVSSGQPALPAADQAAMLACAQYFREHMGKCDAALRTLPHDIEASVLASAPPQENSCLGAFLRAARQKTAASAPPSGTAQNPLNALFLPLKPARDMPPHPLTLPLTHPHTYLAKTTNAPQKQKEAAVSPGRFLAAAAAALSHPFYPLFMRSPVAAPYAALLLLP